MIGRSISTNFYVEKGIWSWQAPTDKLGPIVCGILGNYGDFYKSRYISSVRCLGKASWKLHHQSFLMSQLATDFIHLWV